MCLKPIISIIRKLSIARAKVVVKSAVGALRPKTLKRADDRIKAKTEKKSGDMYDSFSPKLLLAKPSKISTAASIKFYIPRYLFKDALILTKIARAMRPSL